MPGQRILVVEDRDSLRKLLCHALSAEGYEAIDAADGELAAQLLSRESFDLVISDLRLPASSGLEVLAVSRRVQPKAPVIVMTAYGTVSDAVEAMKLGAFDFLEKPVEVDDLLDLVEAAIGDSAREEAFSAPGAPTIIGRHPRLRAAQRLLKRVAPTESTVLLTGESGTGKELFARCLHGFSKRASGPFIAVNCAALPEALMENELFGHEKGAFTGADRRQAGRFEKAQSGTLFLDEIGELALGVQAKVLRVLEERTFERVGGGSTQRSDARLVAATNRNLETMVREGTFRADLFYRLEIFPIEIPPLRHRRSDVPLLARHLLGILSERHGRPKLQLTEEACRFLSQRPWPGNVRELGNLLERAIIVCDGPRLTASDLDQLGKPPAEDERTRVRQVLREAGGDKKEAAKLLGVSYRTLQRRVQRYDLEGYPTYRDTSDDE